MRYKKSICIFEIAVLIIASVAFSYSLSEAFGTETVKSQEKSIFSKIANLIAEKIKQPIFQMVSAVDTPAKCCERTLSGAVCQEVLTNAECQVGKQISPTRCASTTFCNLGCCVDDTFGTYDKNVPQVLCQGRWVADANCGIEEARNGCCILGAEAVYTTRRHCEWEIAHGSGNGSGIMDFRLGYNEAQCIGLSTTQSKGACLTSNRGCTFLTKQECVALTGSSNGFYKNVLCTAPELNTTCQKTRDTKCIAGKDEVYFVDTCGNTANVYDASKVDNEDYWRRVYSRTESCNPGSGNANSRDCGNCNRFLGGYCSAKNSSAITPTFGNNYCKDMSCTFNGQKYRNGESWCVYDGKIGNGEDVVGSRHWKYVCAQGEVMVEPCADYRNQICVQDDQQITNSSEKFSSAVCRMNNWRVCVDLNTKDSKDIAGECAKIPDCTVKKVNLGKSFAFDTCVGKYPGGFDLNQTAVEQAEIKKSDAGAVCELATRTCVVIYEQTMMGGCECVENCDCETGKFAKQMNDVCTSLGDCGGEANIAGEYVQNYKVSGAPKLSSEEVNRLKGLANSVNGQKATPEDFAALAARDDSGAIASTIMKESSGVRGQELAMAFNNAYTGASQTSNNAVTGNIVFVTAMAIRNWVTGNAESGVIIQVPSAPVETAPAVVGAGPTQASLAAQAPFYTAPTDAAYKEALLNIISKPSSAAVSPTSIEPLSLTDILSYRMDTSPTPVLSAGPSQSALNTYTGAPIDLPPAPSTSPTAGQIIDPGVPGVPYDVYGIQEVMTPQDVAVYNELGLGREPGSMSYLNSEGEFGTALDVNGNPTTPAGSTETPSPAGFNVAGFVGGIVGGILGGMAGQALAKSLGLSPIGSMMMSMGMGMIGANFGSMAATYIFNPAAFNPISPLCLDPISCTMLVVGVILVLVSLFFGGSKCKPKKVTYTCQPWQAPSGGSNCEKCNDDPLKPCSEYRCKSLGAGCEIINKGTIDEMCMQTNANDATPPSINPINPGNGSDLVYTNVSTNGFKVSSQSTGCIAAYSNFTIKLNTSEPSQCRFDLQPKTNFDDFELDFGTTSYLKTHEINFVLPNPEGCGYVINNSIKFYIKCQDKNGNLNPGVYTVETCINQGPDRTPPAVQTTLPAKDSLVRYNSTQTTTAFLLTEPSNCRWSTTDKSYGEMENEMNCTTDCESLPRCMTTIPSTNLTNTYYVKCKDQPWLEGNRSSERNENQEAYVYTLRKPLLPINITAVAPSVDFEIFNSPTTGTLRVLTSGGGDYHRCSYRVASYSLVQFQNTFSTTHDQEIQWYPGRYNIYIECEDETGDKSSKTTIFQVTQDSSPPLITRVFRRGNTLTFDTSENGDCRYSTNVAIGCVFNFNNASGAGTGKQHSISARGGDYYFIKCKDNFGNIPDGCSFIASPTT